jgi:putative ABC transport system substrate-binding protein
MRQMLVAALLSALVAVNAHAQEPGRTYRVGVLTMNRQVAETTRRDMVPRLAQLGFSEGRNLIFDVRTGPRDEIPGLVGLARDLADRSDVIVVLGFLSLVAAGEATRTVPIVTLGTDPTALGLAQSFSRPGGNVTGIAQFFSALGQKRVELLHEAVPTVRRIAVLTRHEAPLAGNEGNDVEDLITAMANAGVDVRLFYADTLQEYPAAFAAMREAGMEALSIAGFSQFLEDFAQFQALAMEARLPTACADANYVRTGCMLSYGVNSPLLRARLAEYVARVLRGEFPAEMPIERASQFEMALNLRTARALGITISPALRADEVIE